MLKLYQESFHSKILHTMVLKPKADFIGELISIKIIQPKKVLSISEVSVRLKNSKFKENFNVSTKKSIETIEKLTIG